MPIPTYSGSFGDVELSHLLRRTMFGLTKPALTHFSGMSMNQVVSELLTPAPSPAPPINYASANDPDVPLGQTWTTVPSSSLFNGSRRTSLKAWWIGQMLNQGYSIHEKMIVFWHNHVPIEYLGYEPNYLYQYVQLLRTHALGNFKTLMRDMSTNTAMLKYLNGELNTATAPNENYARELQELFVIGKDLPSYFSESDIQEAAKVLTGWRVNNTTESAYFTASRHNSSNKVFSAFYNNTVILGRNTATAGIEELDDLLNMLFAHDEAAKFIVRKLYRFFVYYQIDASVEADVISPLAQTFRNNNYEILPVLQELFSSQHFYDTMQQRSHIKNPLDFIIGTIRAINPVYPASIIDQYNGWRSVNTACFNQQMELGDAPNVAGWPAYYQSPSFHEIWINADTLRRKKEFVGSYLNTNGVNGVKLNYLAFTAALDHPEDPDLLIEEVLLLLHALPSDPATKTALKSILLSNQTLNSYWTTAWQNYLSAPTNTTFLNTVTSRLKSFYTAVLTMAEAYLA
jgi:uncharacterized protein (DUF1800 family)